ncbi:MAG: aminodeoxychorismate/anthranilate synthase component II [Magnetococcales bacterium]|nr:aminodeoxychorismate/anthranilate synthase component II [Magnetococcales bacterium]
MVLLIDNYDSFTYNLAQYLGELGQEVQVVRNDAITLAEIATLAPSHLLLSPGPGNPDQAGITLEVITHFSGRIPILGVCLGHQAIGQAFGGQVVRAPKLMHGKTSAIYHDRSGVFQGLNNPLTATRYHSLVVAEETIPACLHINAWTDPACESGRLVMGLRHKELPVHGVQFHPESILTEQGHDMLANFLKSVVA